MLNDESPARVRIIQSICHSHPTLQSAVMQAIEVVKNDLAAETIDCFACFDYNESIDLACEWIEDLFSKENTPVSVIGWNFGIGDYTVENPLYCLYLAGYEKFELNDSMLIAEYGWLPDRRIIYDQGFFQELSHYCAHLPDGIGIFLCKAYAIALAINLGQCFANNISFATRSCYPFACSVDGVNEVFIVGGITKNGMGLLPYDLL